MTGSTEPANNVTNIRVKSSGGRTKSGRVEQLLERLGKIMHGKLEQVLPALLDEADDRLFELAERASTNQLQTRYFDVMRNVRKVRPQIEQRFLRELDQTIINRLAAKGAHDVNASISQVAELDASSFTLVGEDEFEETVAVKNLCTKLRNLCQDELFALDRRIAFVLADPSIDGDENPFAPECLASAASAAMREVELTVELRLLMLKLVDRHLSHAARDAYTEMNQFLVANNVLPDVRVRTPGTARGPSSDNQSLHYRAQSTQGKWVRSAAATMHPGDGVTSGAVAQGHAGAGHPVGPLTDDERVEQVLGMLGNILTVSTARTLNHDMSTVSPQQLVGGFTEMQRGQFVEGEPANVLRELRASSAAANLNQTDGMLIDVVAMMFDYVLDDENIVESVRALVARLQIPVLKVAILDKTFFARRTHPARQFVNALAEFGARMNVGDGAGDPVFDRLEALVQKLLADFESDLSVFAEALEALGKINEEEEQRAQENAWHESKIAEERSRMERCREEAMSEVRARIETQDPPASISEFLTQHWRHLLANVLYQHGGESKHWRASVQTMDNLIWSTSPKTGTQDRDRLLAMLPFLLKRLKSGMDELCLPKAARDEFLKSLSDFHLAAIRAGEAVAVHSEVAPTNETAEVATDDNQTSATESRAVLQDDVGPVDAEQRMSASIQRANRLVFDTAEARIQCRGMGTTVVAVAFESREAICAHVGDSRIYRLREGELTQLTRDHTYRQQMLDRGLCDESNAHKIAGNLITRAIGAEETTLVDVARVDLASDDIFLLCSDGLSDMIDDGHILSIIEECVARNDALSQGCQGLVDAANAAGGRDNVTAALVRVRELAGDGVEFDASTMLEMASATDSGRVRPHNEDAVAFDADAAIVVLADGMGGCNAGEVASAMTVKVVMDDHALVSHAAEHGEHEEAEKTGHAFDFDTIKATFWDDTLPEGERSRFYEAVAEEVEQITLSGIDSLDNDFDINGAADNAGAGDQAPIKVTDPHLSRVFAMSEGTWVEFVAGDGERVRASVSWIAPDRGRYLFTGRFGQKIADSTPYGLALELRNDRLRILDAVPLFDRAINNLSSKLRSSEPAEASV